MRQSCASLEQRKVYKSYGVGSTEAEYSISKFRLKEHEFLFRSCSSISSILYVAVCVCVCVCMCRSQLSYCTCNYFEYSFDLINAGWRESKSNVCYQQQLWYGMFEIRFTDEKTIKREKSNTNCDVKRGGREGGRVKRNTNIDYRCSKKMLKIE